MFKGLDRPAGAELVIKTIPVASQSESQPTPIAVPVEIVEEPKAEITIVEASVPAEAAEVALITAIAEAVAEEPTSKPAAVVEEKMQSSAPVEIDVTAPVIHIDIPHAKQQQTTPEHQPSTTSPTHKKLHTPKLPCLTCTGDKDEADEKKKDAPVEKPTATKPVEIDITSSPEIVVVVDTPAAPTVSAELPQAETIAPASVLVVDVNTPPKKPPRGLVDVDVDVSATAAAVESIQLEGVKPIPETGMFMFLFIYFLIESNLGEFCCLIFFYLFKSLNYFGMFKEFNQFVLFFINFFIMYFSKNNIFKKKYSQNQYQDRFGK